MRRGRSVPSWHAERRQWRGYIDGKKVNVAPGLGIIPDEQPQFQGVV
jgi:hypothetical protein